MPENAAEKQFAAEPHAEPPSGTPPVAPEVPAERTHHGITVNDPYEWLRAKDSPLVLAHLKAENTYTEQRSRHLAPLRESLFNEIKDRTQESDMSVPSRKGRWWYFSRTTEGRQYAAHCRAPVDSPDDWEPPAITAAQPLPGEQVLLDGNTEAQGHVFFSLGAFDVSPDGTLLAYSTDTVGDERFLVHVKDLETGALLPDEIPDTNYSLTWSRDGSTLFYTTVDSAWRPYKVWRHRLGANVADDDLIYHEMDESFFVGVGSTRSERFVVIAASSKVTSEVRVLEADDPADTPRLIAARRSGVEYHVEHAVIDGEDRFLVLHNDGAENFMLAEAPVHTPGPEHWRSVLDHRDDVRLEDVEAFATHLVIAYRRDALPRTAVLPLVDGGYGEAREVAFDEELYSCYPAANPEWSQPHVRIAYTSFVTPASVYDQFLAGDRRVLRKQQPVLAGYDPDDYEQHRDWATADDGVAVPISIVCRRGTARDGSAPGLIYGYGAYEMSMDPSFVVSRLSLLDRGMVFAVAHVRGGGELGRGWYDTGKMLTKRNTFTDFVSCAQHLAASGWTAADRLVAMGGSAGGLLIGAALNLAPHAFAGALAAVPFVDALTSILDPSLPLTVIEWDEWGDPLHDPDVYAYMSGYSPYDNVRTAAYPPVLATTSLNDTRVLYVEPAKWVARLRAFNDGAPGVLLKTEMAAGHGGVSGRYEAWRERAFEYAWVIDTAGAPHLPPTRR
ncbi:MAG: S9 family peptidase [Nocardioidaceae bacterium]|nr:S9 family peptidase [Nocardioidaceae bacterium]